MGNKERLYLFTLLGVTLSSVAAILVFSGIALHPKRLPFPSKVLVGGHVYTMRYDKNIYPDYYGLTLEDEKKILIVPDESLEWEQEIVVHELMHCAHFDVLRAVKKVEKDNAAADPPAAPVKGQDLISLILGKAPKQDKFTADEWIEATAPGWTELLRNNPDLVRYLTQVE